MKRLASLLTVPAFLTLLFDCAGPGESPRFEPDYFAEELGGTMMTVSEGGASFRMGDTVEKLQTIAVGFSLSKTEITNGQYARFIDAAGYTDESLWTTNGMAWCISHGVTTPAQWQNANCNDPDQPVSGVSWYEAVAYCNWLSREDGRTPAYQATGEIDSGANGYRLPTEAEWEYAAARAGGGSDRKYPYGDEFKGDTKTQPGAQVWWDLDPETPIWWDPDPATADPDGPAPVGSCNGGDTPLGLSDMAGNVKEWCSDNWVEMGNITEDSSYRFSGDLHGNSIFVTRGGGFYYDQTPAELTTACRDYASAGFRREDIGFRILRPAD